MTQVFIIHDPFYDGFTDAFELIAPGNVFSTLELAKAACQSLFNRRAVNEDATLSWGVVSEDILTTEQRFYVGGDHRRVERCFYIFTRTLDEILRRGVEPDEEREANHVYKLVKKSP